jgi:RluA family pseudouridine synthase
LSASTQKILTVPGSQAGVQLRDFLARAFPGTDRAALRQLQARGRVRVNGMPADNHQRLLPQDHVELQVEDGDLVPHAPARTAPDLPVLHESPTELVVDKPAGLVTVPDRDGAETGVHGRLQQLRPLADLRIVHRLDRDTSGCLILACGLQAAQHFDAEFRAGRVHKHYTALVAGVVGPDRQEVALFLGPDPKRPGRVVAARRARPGFRAARTLVTVAVRFAGYTLLALQPQTGRSHQLRAHLRALGHPIVGDDAYGGPPLRLSSLKHGYKLRPGKEERPLLARMFLHCARVQFHRPDGGVVAVEAGLARDLQLALAKVERFAAGRPGRV